MARLPRLVVAGYPHHIILRGHNRQMLFESESDFVLMRGFLEEVFADRRLALHAYLIMGNHLHLLITPDVDELLSAAIKVLAQRYAQAFNKRRERTGSVWEGRFKASLIDSERYLLACMGYIDSNPVRAGIVSTAEQYRWSSYTHNAGIIRDVLVSEHSLYWSLGNTPFSREAAYRAIVQGGIELAQQAQLTDSALKGRMLGSSDFIAKLQQSTDVPLQTRRVGRPTKQN
jgi:putative transposase